MGICLINFSFSVCFRRLSRFRGIPSPQSSKQVDGILVTLRFILFQQFIQDGLQAGSDCRVIAGCRGNGLLQMLEGYAHRAVAVKGQSLCQHFIEDDAKRIEVGLLSGQFALSLFR